MTKSARDQLCLMSQHSLITILIQYITYTVMVLCVFLKISFDKKNVESNVVHNFYQRKVQKGTKG